MLVIVHQISFPEPGAVAKSSASSLDSEEMKAIANLPVVIFGTPYEHFSESWLWILWQTFTDFNITNHPTVQVDAVGPRINTNKEGVVSIEFVGNVPVKLVNLNQSDTELWVTDGDRWSNWPDRDWASFRKMTEAIRTDDSKSGRVATLKGFLTEIIVEDAERRERSVSRTKALLAKQSQGANTMSLLASSLKS